MDFSILFMGPVGAGKTEAIRSLSDIEVVDTDVLPTDGTALLKATTTVSMDVGVLDLGDGYKLRMYGAPGQDRFDFMWEILLDQAKGIVILLNHAAADPIADFDHYVARIHAALGGRKLPTAIGITHIDDDAATAIDIYQAHLRRVTIPFAACMPAILQMDARSRHDVRAMVMALGGMLEMQHRFAPRTRA